MFGWCKPRKDFVGKLIDGSRFEFLENERCVFHDLGDLYSVSYDVDFTKENFYKKFKVIHRETECFEMDCIVDIVAYEKVNSAKERSYLVHSIYLEKYYEWLNNLYGFKKDLAFQELVDFSDYERDIDSKTSKKIYSDFKKYHNEAKLYDEQLKVNNSFIKMYESMMHAFKYASNDGKVEFI